jgi:hypothetical protein
MGILGPIPVLAGQLFAAINCSIYFALQKHKLPKAGFCQIAFRGFHFVSPFCQEQEVGLSPLAIEKGLSSNASAMEKSSPYPSKASKNVAHWSV